MPSLADLLRELEDLNIPAKLVRLPADLYDTLLDWGEGAADDEDDRDDED